jgi:hypothetical protein
MTTLTWERLFGFCRRLSPGETTSAELWTERRRLSNASCGANEPGRPSGKVTAEAGPVAPSRTEVRPVSPQQRLVSPAKMQRSGVVMKPPTTEALGFYLGRISERGRCSRHVFVRRVWMHHSWRVEDQQGNRHVISIGEDCHLAHRQLHGPDALGVLDTRAVVCH